MKRLWIIIGFALLLPGCVSQTVDSEGNPIGKTKLSDELVIDSAGRVIARPTHIYAPDRIVVNGDTPTERVALEMNALEVRIEAPGGLHVGVRDVASRARADTRQLTTLGHDYLLPLVP